MASRPWNYGSGPAMLPEEVLHEAQGALVNLNGSGLSVLEISHRSPTFQRVIDEADANLRSLLSIPDTHSVIFTQGGATLQFAAVPLNLIGLPASSNRPSYLVTGAWSQKAFAEAKRYGEPVAICDGASDGFRGVPAPSTWAPIDPTTPYIYYCDNETVHGVAFGGVRPPAELVVPTSDPAAKLDHVPIVVDMSSSLLTRRIEVSAYDVIIAGAQKNCGISGLTIVIVRKQLLGHALRTTPVVMDYKTLAESGSMHNTPATFSIYVAGLVFQWVLRNGGLEAMEQASLRRAAALYQAIDESRHFRANVEAGSRSNVNITFRVWDAEGTAPSAALEKAFVAAAVAHSPAMLELAGHRSVGGLRASLYNAMPFEGVEALVALIRSFDAKQAQ